MYIKSLLVVGTAPDGPIYDPIPVNLDNPQDIENALLTFGEEIADFAVYNPSTTGKVLSQIPWGFPQLISRISNGYKNHTIDSPSISGTLFYHPTPALSTPVTGYLIYRSKPIETENPGTTSLTISLRRAALQHNITPISDGNVHLLRITSSGATRAAITIGPLQFRALYPGLHSHNTKIEITSEKITIIPYPNSSFTQPSEYWFEKPQTAYVPLPKNRVYYKTIGDIANAINFSAQQKTIPVSCQMATGVVDSTAYSTLLSYVGTYAPTGGASGSIPSSADYYTTLRDLDLSEYAIIALPGKVGRDIFPNVFELLLDPLDFPFRVICSASGDIEAGVVSASGSRLDRWQHNRLSLVSGKLKMGQQYPSTTDLVVPYGVILASQEGAKGLGTRAPLNGDLTGYLYDENELKTLAERGVVVPTLGLKGPVIYRGTSTDKNSSPTTIACLHAVYKALLPALYKIIGESGPDLIPTAERDCEKSFQSAISQGCPILSYVFQVAQSNTDVFVYLEMQIAGQLESISAKVQIPLGAGVPSRSVTL